MKFKPGDHVKYKDDLSFAGIVKWCGPLKEASKLKYVGFKSTDDALVVTYTDESGYDFISSLLPMTDLDRALE